MVTWLRIPWRKSFYYWIWLRPSPGSSTTPEYIKFCKKNWEMRWEVSWFSIAKVTRFSDDGFHSPLATESESLPPGNTNGGSITVLLTSYFTGLDKSVLQIKTKIVSCHTANSIPVKQEVNGTLIPPPSVFPYFNYQIQNRRIIPFMTSYDGI